MNTEPFDPYGDTVSPANTCPKCGQNHKDFLRLDEDEDRLTCQKCGTNYPWTSDASTPPKLTVEVGQTWWDAPEERTLSIQKIVEGRATCGIGATGRTTKIKVDRLLTEKRYKLSRIVGGKRVILTEEQ